jgi:diguanylate cyclase (GGDEF)-like protein
MGQFQSLDEFYVDPNVSIRLLIVDDEEFTLKALRKVFSDKTFIVTTTNNAKTALEILETHYIDVILSDLCMPEIDGLCFLEKCQEFYPTTPRIAISGKASPNDLIKLINLTKISAFIAKPWKADELIQQVQEAARKRYLDYYCAQILKLENEELNRLSERDYLTKIYNRRKLNAVLDHQQEQFLRYQTPFSVVILDLDHFKQVNDIYGHQTGDRFLQEVVERINNRIRKLDIFGRWGGEEFIVICPSTNQEGAMKLAQSLCSTIAETAFEHIGNRTASFGVSEFTSETQTIEKLIEQADTALYQAKQTGRNRVVSAVDELPRAIG